ncbi:MAG: LysR family transcriptional regulator [Burkholderiaceae bacterium]
MAVHERIKFRQIEAFRYVMTEGSITRAADAMALSQPAVSHLISDLEAWLGFSLFERRAGRPLTATREAESLFAEVSRSFVGLDELTRAAREIKMLRGGHLRVVAPGFIANSILCDATAAFLAGHGDASVTLEVQPHQDIVAMIAAKVVDLGVAVLPVHHPLIDVSEIGDFEVVCAVPRTHPLARPRHIRPEQLEGEDLIANTSGTQIDLVTEKQLQSAGVRVTRRIAARNQEIACNLVARGLGIAAIARPLPPHIARYPGVVFRPFEPAARITIGLLLPNAREPSRLVTDFIARVRESTKLLTLPPERTRAKLRR